MPDCDDYPDLYFPDDDGNFAWEHSDWGKDPIQEFSTFQEAIEWAKQNPGKAIIRSPRGNGFIEKK